MSDIGERVRFLMANSDMTPDGAMLFVAECFALGVKASAYRDDVTRARKLTGLTSTGLRLVAIDEGGKVED